MLPRSFGPYVLFDFVGKGGMAETYLARQKMQLGGTRLCVIKQILPSLAADRQFSDMLVHEAKLAARLSHANLVEVLHLGREDGRLFIAMEYVEGFDLNCLLGRLSRARVPLPLEYSLYIVAEALRGLDYAHRRRDDSGAPLRLVHRDVSPSNLLVSFEGEVKLCDFGIARANDEVGVAREVDRAHELEEALRGKAGYMSPEHARGEAVDARADVFAAGIVLWELASGRRMYKRRDGGPSLLELAQRADVPELDSNDMTGEQARGLRVILGKALAVDREQRYASAAAMLRDLEAYVARAKLMTSGPAFGQWLTKTLGEEIIARRRSRERAVAALERGAPLVMEPISQVPTSPVTAVVPAPAGRDLATQKGGKRAISRIVFVAMALLTLAAAVLTNAMR